MDVERLSGSPIGSLIEIEGGYGFAPHRLPRSVSLEADVLLLLDRATRAVATIAGMSEASALPTLEIVTRPLLRREAVLSSKIEGTQTTISQLLLFEVTEGGEDPAGDASEVANYLKALDHGLHMLHTLPISLRLCNEMHSILLRGVRGDDQRPGELRTVQVHIGPARSPLADATFVPPPPGLLRDLVLDLEEFVNEDVLPPLIQAAMLHYQFEAIHPYRDGNGRLGRLLIILLLCSNEVLPAPLLHISPYFEKHHEQYYLELFELSATGDWARWFSFFLQGVVEQSADAIRRIRAVTQLRDQYRTMPIGRRASAYALRLIDELFITPVISAPQAARRIGVSEEGARGVLERLREAGVVEIVRTTRPVLYAATELIRIIEAPSASS